MDIEIKIRYLIRAKTSWEELRMTPEEYFDLDEDEIPEVDSVPKYNHGVNYLPEFGYSIFEFKRRQDSQAQLFGSGSFEGGNNTSSEREMLYNQVTQKIAATKIIIKQDVKQRQITERFWHNGNNRIIERCDFKDDQIVDSEIIIETQVKQNPPIWEIIRLGREQEVMTPYYHGLIQDNDDGSQTETLFTIEPLVTDFFNAQTPLLL